MLKHWTAGKAEINVQLRQMRFQQVIGAAVFAQIAHRDRRIYIIKSFYWDIRCKHLFQRGNAVRKIGSDHCNIGIAQLRLYRGEDILPIFKDLYFTILRIGQVAIVLVPLDIMLEKYNPMATTMQRLAQRTERCRVSVTPGRGDRKTKNS